MGDQVLGQPGLDAIVRHLEIVSWIAGLALILALAAWIPWIIRRISGTQIGSGNPHSSIGICFYHLATALICGILYILRKFKWMLAGAALFGLFLAFHAAQKNLTLGIAALFLILFSGICLSRCVQHKWLALTGVVLIWLMLVNLFVYAAAPEWMHWPANLLKVETGLNLYRYKNTEWQDPVVQTLRVSDIDYQRPNSLILEGSNFSLKIESWLFIDNPGTYELSIRSDDGSFLDLDGQRLLSNPGFHGPREVSVKQHLTHGYHPVTVTYFNGTADAVLQLFWAPPGSAKQIVPSRAFFVQVPTTSRRILHYVITRFFTIWLNLLLGLTGLLLLFRSCRDTRHWTSSDYMKKKVRDLFILGRRNLKGKAPSICFGIIWGMIALFLYGVWYYGIHYAPVTHGLSAQYYDTDTFQQPGDLLNGKNARFHNLTSDVFNHHAFSVRFLGYLMIDNPGKYSFRIQADNGSRFYVDNQAIIDGWKGDPRSHSTGNIVLEKGLHRIRIDLHNRFLPAFIDWRVSDPDSTRFKAVSLWDLYFEKPSTEELKQDVRFQFIRIMLLLVLSGILVLGMIWSIYWAFPTINARFMWLFSAMLFLSGFLIQAAWMDPDHQYGLHWFLYLPLWGKALVIAGLMVVSLPEIRQLAANLREAAAKSRSMQVFLFYGALFAAGWGQYCFTGMGSPNPARGVLLFGLAFLMVILNSRLLPSWSRDTAREESSWESLQILVFLMILFGAAFLRFYRLHELPPGLWWDEAQTGIVSRDILKGLFPPIYDLRINAGAPASYIISAWFHFFGSSILALRAYYATVGVVTVFVSYHFFRVFFCRWWSLFGMALVATSRWLFSINRVAMATIDETILLTFLVVLFYVKASRSGRLRHYIITGFLLGTGLYLHTGARVLPVIIGVDLMIRTVFERGDFIRKHGVHAIVMIVISVCVFTPLAVHIYTHRADYFYRSKQTLLSTEFPGWVPTQPLLENVVHYMEMYPYAGDWHPRHNYQREPQLPPLVSILALLGAAIFVDRFYKRDSRLFLMGFALVSMQGILTVHNGTANLNRVAENIPIVHLWAVVGCLFISNGVQRFTKHRFARVIVILGALSIIGVSSVRAYRVYFHDYSKDHALIGVFGFQPELTEPAKYVSGLLKSQDNIHIWAEYTGSDSFEYIQPGHPRLHNITQVGLPRGKRRGPTAIVVLSQNVEMTESVGRRYPDSIVREIPYSLDPNHILFRVFLINTGIED
jgi:PA14 domain/Dolichyl-phosphate-mannose-protein mannosyltransferase